MTERDQVYNMILSIRQEQEEAQAEERDWQGFVIDSPSKANWAVAIIKEARRRRDDFKSAAQDKIQWIQKGMEESDKRCENETAYLLSALGQYIETVPAKKTKTQKVFILPDGKLKKKFPSTVFKADEEKLLKYLEGEEEYIKVTKKPEWGEFKKLLQLVDGKVVRTDTGEIVEGVLLEEKPATFDVE